jgi:hypothetical protein
MHYCAVEGIETEGIETLKFPVLDPSLLCPNTATARNAFASHPPPRQSAILVVSKCQFDTSPKNLDGDQNIQLLLRLNTHDSVADVPAIVHVKSLAMKWKR